MNSSAVENVTLESQLVNALPEEVLVLSAVKVAPYPKDRDPRTTEDRAHRVTPDSKPERPRCENETSKTTEFPTKPPSDGISATSAIHVALQRHRSPTSKCTLWTHMPVMSPALWEKNEQPAIVFVKWEMCETRIAASREQR